jgi:hypothetical protein
MENLPVHISFQLVILGFGASSIVDFLRGLILKIEDYPRLAANWRFFPFILGALGINLFPSIVPGDDLLILWAHGAASPLVAFYAYPYIKAAFTPKALGDIGLKAIPKLPTPEPPDPKKEGTS